MDPTVAALLGSGITGILALLAGFGVEGIRSRADRKKHLREIGLTLSKMMYERQFWMAENMPNHTHQLKSVDYWFTYYMHFAERFPDSSGSTEDLKKFLADMSALEPVLGDWIDSNSEDHKRYEER